MSYAVEIESKAELSFWDQLMERSYRLESVAVEAGYYADQIHDASGLSMGALATIQNYGSVRAHIPPRDFMTLSAVYWSENSVSFTKAFQDYAFKRKDLKTSMAPVGRLGMRSIQKAINSQMFLPLAPATIAAKGSSTILVETGELLKSPLWKVGMV